MQRLPTQIGDVLMLQTERGIKIHAVGRVTKHGQQDFHAQQTPVYIVEHAEVIPEPGWGGVLSLIWIPERIAAALGPRD